MTLNTAIIGGTSGIGLDTALYLKKQDYSVVIGGRSKNKEILDIPYKFIDVTIEDSIKEFFFSFPMDTLDSLVFSAGITTPKKSIEDFNVTQYQKVHDVNLLGAILTLKYAYPLLKKSKGKVVLINSMAARTYSKFSGFEYTVTKAALSGLAKQLAIEWAKDNILINSLFPSMVKTPMLEKNVTKETMDPIENEIPLKRIARPEEISSMIEYLISPKNTYMTGSGIDINGGQFLTG